jgi:hypothetical protein
MLQVLQWVLQKTPLTVNPLVIEYIDAGEDLVGR